MNECISGVCCLVCIYKVIETIKLLCGGCLVSSLQKKLRPRAVVGPKVTPWETEQLDPVANIQGSESCTFLYAGQGATSSSSSYVQGHSTACWWEYPKDKGGTFSFCPPCVHSACTQSPRAIHPCITLNQTSQQYPHPPAHTCHSPGGRQKPSLLKIALCY